MCHQITYTLPCEHTRTDIVYCADAPAESSKSSSSSGGSSSKSSKKDSGKKHHSSSSSSKGKDKEKKGSSSKSSSSSSSKRKPCRNLTAQSIAYPMPPSFEGSPATAASSPLLPKCPLPNCPFEQRNRCWNCCWCGKRFNEYGRCSCIMIIDGNKVWCEHICCETCTPAGPM
ncbi:hypothetical protein J7T55_005001 [Diaporthe amygdali]|uniref:uncharacterized protein n=1 Tax=Phomopsis amygdali TaxID=1214568 RepID=UPI0022FE261B|nr:uncharacterized protein J7T55_005001 [Diaporthe amygdali]KAJ0116056.1 hypothetical protein J7T55_005001 [Diaporthe amygdali]